jgi:hypothetical protein
MYNPLFHKKLFLLKQVDLCYIIVMISDNANQRVTQHLSDTRVYICFGTPEPHLNQLKSAPRKGRFNWWTIKKSARPEDIVIFYMIRPLTAFVATGVVESEVYRLNDKKSKWYDDPGAYIKNVQMLPRYVTLAEAKQAFPEWKYLRGLQKSSDVPRNFAKRFLQLLIENNQDKIRFAEESDIEGTKTEVVRLISHRNRRLRDLAFQEANGKCCVCKRDFSKILAGQGVRVLEVHHRRQLSSLEMPSITKSSDLAVVCANCHMLLHINPKKALDVEELKCMLEPDGFYERT